MMCRFWFDHSTCRHNVSTLSTCHDYVSIFYGFLDIFLLIVERFADKIARLREQLDAQFAESAEMETQIKANLKELGL